MAKLDLPREVGVDELSVFLRRELANEKVEATATTVWVIDNLFQACRVRPKTVKGAAALYVMGDMTLPGRIALIGGLLLLALVIFATTNVIILPGVLFIVGAYALRFLPSRSIERRVRVVLEKLPSELPASK